MRNQIVIRVIIYALTQRYFNWIKIVQFLYHFFIIQIQILFSDWYIDITDRYIYYDLLLFAIIALFAAILIINLSNADICTL